MTSKPVIRAIFFVFAVMMFSPGLHADNNSCWEKEEIMKKLRKNQIDSRPLFYPLNSMPPYKTNEKFPVSEELNRKGINLPSSIALKKEDIKNIVEIIKNV